MRALTRLQSRRGQQGQIVILTGLTLIVCLLYTSDAADE